MKFFFILGKIVKYFRNGLEFTIDYFDVECDWLSSGVKMCKNEKKSGNGRNER